MNIQQAQEKIADLKNQARDEIDDKKFEILHQEIINVRKIIKQQIQIDFTNQNTKKATDN